MKEQAQPFLNWIQPRGILSFGPETEPIALRPLNVLIGPNGSGRSNFIELLEVLHAAPTNLQDAFRSGGGAAEWRWKGATAPPISLEVSANIDWPPGIRYRLHLRTDGAGLYVLDEVIEDDDVKYYSRGPQGAPRLRLATGGEQIVNLSGLDRRRSILSQRKDPDLYPQITFLVEDLQRIALYREWNFGRTSALRMPQPADLPDDALLPDAHNLPMFLNALEHGPKWIELREILKRFLPRFDHLSTRVTGGTVQVFVHEQGLSTPVPATRLSDGTLRFIALAAILLNPDFASLICIEEPELGMHPDAIALLAELMREASHTTQLVVTTHSDVLLSSLSDEPESVMVCENLRGQTSIRRLDQEQLNYWLRDSTLGEVWRNGAIGGNV